MRSTRVCAYDRSSIAAVGDVALLHRPGFDLFRAGWDDADLRIANLEAPLTRRRGSPPPSDPPAEPARSGGVAARRSVVRRGFAAPTTTSWTGATGPRVDAERAGPGGVHYAGAGLTDADGRRSAAAAGERLDNRLSVVGVHGASRLPRQRPGARLAAVRVRHLVRRRRAARSTSSPVHHHGSIPSPGLTTSPALEHALGAARQAADFVVLAVHWGVPPQWQSNFQGPLAEYQDALAPRLAAAGADLVLGHHAHTVYGVRSRQAAAWCATAWATTFSIPWPARGRCRWTRRRARTTPPERPENRDSFIATFTLAPAGGRLALQEARFAPGHARRRLGSPPRRRDTARSIAERLKAFSTWRGTPTTIDGSSLVWTP